jgi:CDP-paratose 2-epimerase
MRVLVTGGAGFVGSRLAEAFLEAEPGTEVVAFDNLRRRGAELHAADLARRGARFVHGDVRMAADLDDIEGTFDVVIDAAAEPSVHAGMTGSPRYVIDTNLGGTVNLLELARRRAGALVFLSTSRVYSMPALRALATTEGPTRLELDADQPVPGASAAGVSEDFPVTGPRTVYGAGKLASELLVEEYAAAFGLRAVVNRCGVLAGAGQFGKSEQGVIALWVANHVLGLPLRYIGYGGTGKQVRDILHPLDLYALIRLQLDRAEAVSGRVYNVGGGREVSVSLRELTALSAARAGREVPIAAVPETSAVDVPVYISDTARVTAEFGWRPTRDAAAIVDEIATWIERDEARLRPLFA